MTASVQIASTLISIIRDSCEIPVLINTRLLARRIMDSTNMYKVQELATELPSFAISSTDMRHLIEIVLKSIPVTNEPLRSVIVNEVYPHMLKQSSHRIRAELRRSLNMYLNHIEVDHVEQAWVRIHTNELLLRLTKLENIHHCLLRPGSEELCMLTIRHEVDMCATEYGGEQTVPSSNMINAAGDGSTNLFPTAEICLHNESTDKQTS